MTQELKFNNWNIFLYFALMCLLAVGAQAQAFDCDSNLYQVVNGTDLKVLDPVSGTYQLVGSSSIAYNGAGFNVEDGYMYGMSGQNLVRIANNGQATDLGIVKDFSALSYSGDVDTLGNWFSFAQQSGNWRLNVIDVDILPAVAIESEVTELPGVTAASKTNDIAFNATTKKFYGMSGTKIMEFDPYERTVKAIAVYEEADNGGYGAVWSDAQGNTYFFNNATGNIFRAVFQADGSISSFAKIAVSQPNGNNDGMSCSLAAPPVFPEVCDNGIDDDGDGLTDCEDPDCTSSETCGISAAMEATAVACDQSIATYQLFFTNNSPFPNSITVTEELPNGFVFLQDTIEFDLSGFSTFVEQPTTGDTKTLTWGTLQLAGGETVRISYDVSFDEQVTLGIQTNAVKVATTTPNTLAFPATMNHSMALTTCPEPVAYECEPAFYQVYKKKGKREANRYGKLNPKTGTYDPIAIASDYANGLGFDTNTGLVYGASGKKFIRLDAEGLVIDQGITFSKNVYRGDINDQSEWYGVDGSDMVKIAVSGEPTVVDTYAGQGLAGWDMAFHSDGNFYALHHQKLQRFNTTTNTKELVGTITGIGIPEKGGYGAQWTGSDDYLYVSENKTGNIYRIDVASLEARLVSRSVAGLSKNDGFSCPLSIPAVYAYDFSDNSNLPTSQILAYIQDEGNDNIPDFSTVWLGNTISFDENELANAQATGDLDDGFNMSTELINGELSYALGLNSNQTCTSYYLIGLDWDNDGSFDEVIAREETNSGAQTILGNLTAPTGYKAGILNLRLIVSEEPLNTSQISGTLFQLGEVEDYQYTISTGCETCEVPSGFNGGLESNGDLAAAIAKRNFKRTTVPFHKELKSNQLTLEAFDRARTNQQMEFLFPTTGRTGKEEVRISTPEDLVAITNAKKVLAADYYAGDRRVAAALLMETENGVYNHAKNICDRLNDKIIEDVSTISVNGYQLILAKIQDGHGTIEYSTWFALAGAEGDYTLESLWNVDRYPTADYLNFQVWASDLAQIIHLASEIIEKVGNVAPNQIAEQLPAVLVKQGHYAAGQLHLTVSNPNKAKEMLVNYTKRETEQSSEIHAEQVVQLSGAAEEQIVLNTGYLFDAGVAIYTANRAAYDALYLADGAWGTDYNSAVSTVSNFTITAATEGAPSQHQIERGFALKGVSSDVINVFRNLKAGEQTFATDGYTTLSMDLESDQAIEIVLVQKQLENWENRLRMTVPAQPRAAKKVLKLSDFIGYDAEQSYELQSIVFSYLNQTGAREEVAVNVSALAFGNEEVVLATTEDLASFDFNVYPNPVVDSASIQLLHSTATAYTLQLIDAAGSTVALENGQTTFQNTINFQRGTKQSGIYFLKVTLSNGDTKTRRILLK